MRFLSQLLIVIVFCLLAVAIPTLPAQADGAWITLSPNHGVPEDENGVTIYGYNFTANEWVDIYYYINHDDEIWIDDIRTHSNGNFRITFIIPESYRGVHKISADGEDSGYIDVNFTVEPGLTVNHEEGPVGTNITVEGRGFAEREEDMELWYDDEVIEADIPVDEDGSWEVTFQIPPSAQGSHDIDAEGDESQDYDVDDVTFEVTPEISLDKSSGSPGESITMMGSGFYADDRYITILFAGEETETEPEIIRSDENGSWNASFEIPEMPIDEYSITAEGEYTKDVTALNFEIEPGLVLSPDEGHVGTDLTVTGRGFATDEDVYIIYDDIQIATDKTNPEGSFDLSFIVPESKHGKRLVIAEDDEENEATATFTMESKSPDTPEHISPPDGGRVGFIGSVSPTFEWSEVSDDSGVYYRLQIAASNNFTTEGLVDPLFSVDGLVGTNYTLNATQALPNGTYYWIVQAVDGAENESGWTEAHSFRAGFMPRWGFIIMIVLIVVLIGTLVYFFVIRKRVYYY